MQLCRMMPRICNLVLEKNRRRSYCKLIDVDVVKSRADDEFEHLDQQQEQLLFQLQSLLRLPQQPWMLRAIIPVQSHLQLLQEPPSRMLVTEMEDPNNNNNIMQQAAVSDPRILRKEFGSIELSEFFLPRICTTEYFPPRWHCKSVGRRSSSRRTVTARRRIDGFVRSGKSSSDHHGGRHTRFGTVVEDLGLRKEGAAAATGEECSRFLSLLISLMTLLAWIVPCAQGFGSMSSLATTYLDAQQQQHQQQHGGDSNRNSYYSCTVCGIIAGGANQSIRCWDSARQTRIFSVGNGGVSYLGLAGGNGFVCGLQESTRQAFCWNLSNPGRRRRLSPESYVQIVVGESHACGLQRVNGSIDCWKLKGSRHPGISPPAGIAFTAVTAGSNFTCGLTVGSQLVCWGLGLDVNSSTVYSSISAGSRHLCGIRLADGGIECFGDYPVLDQTKTLPENAAFSSLALGDSHSCGLLTDSQEALCWGDNSTSQLTAPQGVAFASITAGDFYTCGIKEKDLSTVCWGEGFSQNRYNFPSSLRIAPGLCTDSPCRIGTYPLNNTAGVGNVCGKSGQFVCLACTTSACGAATTPLPSESPFPSPPLSMQSGSPPKCKSLLGLMLSVFGAVGILVGLLTVICVCNRKKILNGCKFQQNSACSASARRSGRVHHVEDSPTADKITEDSNLAAKRLSRLQSSVNRSRQDLTNRVDTFTFDILAAATENFADGTRIGAGGFGVVYRGLLPDGRKVAIKRADKVSAKICEQNESAFETELEFLSRVNHKHLVNLVGYCDEGEELLLVLEYIPNGTLYDHLHRHDSRWGGHGVISSWSFRVKIALEAARGIEYLHTYAVPAVIHRDIKSSNILLDASWSARVSDFGLSLMGPSEEVSHLSMAAAGTMGYIDPEYYRLQHLTTKSDVYSFGVVLMELLTGKKAIHESSTTTNPINVVDFAAPRIRANELVSILDNRLPTPEAGIEAEAVSILATVAEQCVRQEGKERPSMTQIVSRLEQAFSCINPKPLQQQSDDHHNNNNNANFSSWIQQEIEQQLQLRQDDLNMSADETHLQAHGMPTSQSFSKSLSLELSIASISDVSSRA